jgi:uncharacterized membrane protein YeaQ/YmgE (transglycosylase-associated protein family)
MSILVWIVFGGLAGWIASMFAGTNQRQGMFGNIIVGILGAVIGGWIMSSLGYGDISGFNLYSFVVAVLGAVLLLFIWKMVTGRGKADV